MVYISGIDSVVEAMYLSEGINDCISECNILVNPIDVYYKAEKVVVISDPNYKYKDVQQLIKNRCTVISRVKLECMTGVIFEPYILRPNFNVMWSGDVISEVGSNIVDYCSSTVNSGKLLFPKITKEASDLLMADSDGNLTYLGWGNHQVGVNMVFNTKFTELDSIKTRKVV